MAISTAHKIEMSTEDFNRLREIIYSRSGIHFPDNKKYVLESRLGHRLQELEIEDYDTYISFISFGPYRDDEFQEMFNRITINETSFFRNEPQLEIFEKTILPELLEARKDTKRLRIWSAACSSGEEPYTAAIQLHRTLGVRLPDWRIEILGTDISQKMLDVAASGVYSDYAIRSTPDQIKRRYFKQEGRNWVIDPTIQSMVTFEHMNLKDTMAAKRHGTWDIIFCRNVMIYFDTPMRKSVVQMFYNQLASDGTLIIGHSESLSDLGVPFISRDLPKGFCYTKA
ncbi:MAG: protein-glutamate O-methyltransferase CheR [Phycisphaeraceae bacterium]|nr:protein-glutamate O-methyltransferase CheR [Phycisphaerales bacterium]MCB9860339.1 protein-glutamate O-methyltransferase CheR [Phycisphaeraceae bacterium]